MGEVMGEVYSPSHLILLAALVGLLFWVLALPVLNFMIGAKDAATRKSRRARLRKAGISLWGRGSLLGGWDLHGSRGSGRRQLLWPCARFRDSCVGLLYLGPQSANRPRGN